ncbi:VCBS repeat-containing protein [Actinoallomurus purpureus]|uniref:FG-GAP repeat domain-containing protein n=1 Tax=Actinoallomurus purpureus TaxID=478114 RepID=UPI002093707F|nr:VCBS repeat-containing protein [Actinoallomurus purpureus]MCO6004989.1 VCBS repeat-containing protein [Actinoallomurus purpureus]
MVTIGVTTHLDDAAEEVFFYGVPPVGPGPVVLVKYESFDVQSEPILWEQRITDNPPLPAWRKLTGDALKNRMRASNVRQGGLLGPESGLADYQLRGYVDAPVLSKGDVYRVWGTTDPDADPNRPDTDLTGMKTVLAAGQRGTLLAPDGLVATLGPDKVTVDVATAGRVPVAVVAEIGEGTPKEFPPFGYHAFTRPIGRILLGEPRGTRRVDLVKTDDATGSALRPGGTYTAIVRVMDTNGTWQEHVQQVTLLVRQVDLAVEAVTIVDDGDPGGDSDGDFVVRVFTGNWGDGTATEVRAWRFPADDSFAEFETGDVFGVGGTVHPTGPPWRTAIGPAPVDDRQFGVRLEIFEQDGILEPDERASGVWQRTTDEPVIDGEIFVRTDRNPPYVTAAASGKYSIRYVSAAGPVTGPWQSFGVSFPADFGVEADYDGDQRIDPAVWRPDGGVWFIAPAAGGPVRIQRLGEPQDQPAPADYDRDGRADLAVWRPSTGRWYLQPSSGGPVQERTTGRDGTPLTDQDRQDLFVLSHSLLTQSQRLAAAGRTGEAAEPARGGIEILLRLAPTLDDPKVFDLIAQVGINSGYLPATEAVEPVRQVVPYAQRLARANPDNPDYRYRYPWILVVLAQRLDAAGRRPEAADPTRQALGLFLELAPDANDAYLFDLIAQVGINSGYLPATEAVEPVRQVAPFARRLAEANPANMDYRYRYPWILVVLAQRLDAAGRRLEAADPTRQALGLFMAFAPGANDAYLFDLIAQVGINSGYLPATEAVESVRQAVPFAQRLTETNPANMDYRYRYPWILVVLAQRLDAAGRRPEAADPTRQALGLFMAFAPGANDAYLFDLIAQVGINSGYLPATEAVEPVRQVVPYAQRLALAHPDNAAYQERLTWIQQVLEQRIAAAQAVA